MATFRFLRHAVTPPHTPHTPHTPRQIELAAEEKTAEKVEEKVGVGAMGLEQLVIRKVMKGMQPKISLLCSRKLARMLQLTHDAYLEYTQAVLPAKASLAGTSKALAFGAKLKAKRAAAAKAAAEAAAGGAADVGGGSGGLAMLALAGKAGKAANASPAPAAPPAADVAIDVPPPPPADPDSDLRT
jgi:hypothetical protein